MRSLTKARPPKPLSPLAAFVQSMGYVDVKMRWKKDASFDQVPVLAHARDLRPLASLARLLSPSPTPVSVVSKLRRSLEASDRRVASFMRRFPAAFVESVGPDHNHPWFRLSAPAARLLQEERDVFAAAAPTSPPAFAASSSCPRRAASRSASRRVCSGTSASRRTTSGARSSTLGKMGSRFSPPEMAYIATMARSSWGLLMTGEIKKCHCQCFKRMPYGGFRQHSTGSDVSQKRVSGVLHELFSLFVTCSAERRRLRCLRTHLGLPHKFDRWIERHPHIFYLLFKEKTCFVVLKEAYMAGGDTSIQEHPMLEVRSKYAGLMEESREIIKRRRSGKPVQLDPEDSKVPIRLQSFHRKSLFLADQKMRKWAIWIFATK
ncbi:hypothetical protein ACQ4PT_044900 [Festuca glaucescens]